MSILIYYLIVVFLICCQKSKTLKTLSYAYLLILFCFNYDIADRENYSNLVDTLSERVGSIEIGWQYVALIMQKYKVDVQYMYGIIGFLYLSTLFYIIPKLAYNNNLSIACYMIGIFFLDVVQLRYTFSLIFLLWAFYFLLKRNGRQAFLLFVSLTLISSLIHSSNIVFLLFVFVKKTQPKKVFLLAIMFITLFVVGMTFFTNLVGNMFNIEDKIARITASDDEVSGHSAMVFSSTCVIIFLLTVYASKKYRGGKDDLNVVLNISTLLLTFIPLIILSRDFRRHIYLVYIIVSSLLCKYKKYLSTKLVSIGLVVVAISFFIYSTYSGNRETVFYPIFNNNLLINAFIDIW